MSQAREETGKRQGKEKKAKFLEKISWYKLFFNVINL
jgi:hypothetical protein